METNPIKRLAA